jgi:hypothetical protein
MAAPMKFRRAFGSRKFNTFCRFLYSKKHDSETQQKETHFGFQHIPEDQKEEKGFIDCLYCEQLMK